LIYVSVLIALWGCKQEDKNEKVLVPVSETDVVEVDSIAGRKGEYLVSEEVFWLMQEEPEYHFEKAKQNHISKEMGAAAAEIKKASVYIGSEIKNAGNEEKDQLQTAKDRPCIHTWAL
jgi:hypothetical protein